MRRFIPKPSMWWTVKTNDPVNRSVIKGLLFCVHLDTTAYLLIDHESGPGSFATMYEGKVCTECGKIISEIER